MFNENIRAICQECNEPISSTIDFRLYIINISPCLNCVQKYEKEIIKLKEDLDEERFMN